MKSLDEAVTALFLRREQYYSNKTLKRKKRIKAVFSLAAIICVLALMHGKNLMEEINKSAAPQISSESVQGYPVSGITSGNTEQASDAEIIVINELEDIPMTAKITYPVGNFQIMTRDEVLSYFNLQMEPAKMLPGLCLTEVDTIHGFYSTDAGNMFPYDHFIFMDDSKDVYIDIILQLNGIPQIVLCQSDYFTPRQSWICGKAICIYHWQQENVDFFYAEFMAANGVGIAIQTENTGIRSMCSLIKYFLNQNRIAAREIQPHSVEGD